MTKGANQGEDEDAADLKDAGKGKDAAENEDVGGARDSPLKDPPIQGQLKVNIKFYPSHLNK